MMTIEPDNYEIRETLPSDETGEARDAVTPAGDVIPHPENARYTSVQSDSVQSDLASMHPEFLGTRFQSRSPEDIRLKQLPRILGILVTEGFTTEQQADYALKRREFEDIDPESSDDVIAEVARTIRAHQLDEDRESRDQRTGS